MSKFRITPIGTCRIHTPLSRAAGRYPIELDVRRNYGFVHTSDEALQQVRFLQGEKQFNADVIPLVFRPGGAEDAMRETWERSDLHIVEISSAKRVLCGDDAIQINYLYRYFGDFFGSNERSRHFWNLSRRGNRRDLVHFLRQERAYQLLSPEDKELLVSLSTEQQTLKTIKSDMAEIVERLGRDSVLFVTHVNAAGPDGEILPSRDRLIRWVTLAAQQLDAPVFNPTAAMLEFGQNKALENEGSDLTHYTPAFSDRIYDAMHQEHIAGMLGLRASEAVPDEQSREIVSLAARLETMITGSEFIGGARETHEALERFPGSVPLLHLRGLVRSTIGDFQGAMDDLAAGSFDSLSPAMRTALIEALDAAGNYEEAIKVADKLIREEVDSAAVYRVGAHAAEKVARSALAVAYAKQAYRMDRTDLSSALQALILLTNAGNDDEVAEWRDEIVENIKDSSSGAFELCVWAVRRGDEELFAAGLRLVVRADKWSAIDLMEDALAARLPRAVAASVPVAVGLGKLPPALAERRSAIIRGAAELAQTLADNGRVADAYQIASALAAIPLTSDRQLSASRVAGEGRHLIRDLVSEARAAIGDAQANGDAQAVADFGESFGDIVMEDARSATAVARALQSLGNPQAGLELLKRVNPDNRHNVLVRRWAARLAHSMGDYATALDMYGSLRADGGAEAEKFRPEISRFFETAPPRSQKQLTLLARAGKYADAVRLARSINRYIGTNERTERELSRMHKLLRVRLKEIEEGEGDLEEREPILRQMAEMKPDDTTTLRRLALELMRQFRFAEAAECWEQLFAIDPNNESADRNRVRCATLAERRASASAQVVDIMA